MNGVTKGPTNIVARDISWLAFNDRVLQEAQDESNPIIERLRFLGIFSSNMDEFFRVRYASMKRLSELSDTPKKRLGGQSPSALLKEISDKVKLMQGEGQRVNDLLLDELEKQDIVFVDETELTGGQQDFVRNYFRDKVSPVIFTLILDEETGVPVLKDKSTYLAIKIVKNAEPENPQYALIEVPSDLLGRFVELPKYGKKYVMYLEDVLRYNLRHIFFVYDFDTIEAHTIKITRDAELDLDDDVSKGFLEKMTDSLKDRRVGDPVRFVYDKEIADDMLQFLIRQMDLDPKDSLIAGGRYHNKKDYIKFPNLGESDLEFKPLPPVLHPYLDLDSSIYNVLRKRDALLFLPFQRFTYLIRFLREAAIDPKVVSIQATLYRLADNSRIISALVNAAKNGKKVTVVIELRARFDEAANIKWTEEMQSEGVHVIFGVPGLKVHSKILLVTRRTEEGLERFASIGTGNLNESTSKLYTDYHLLTANPDITRDVAKVFEFLQKNYKRHRYQHLLVSPHYTRKAFVELIDREIYHAKRGNKAGITAKMNSLSDIKIIKKLYEASSYGVPIKLMVRGICSLIPSVKGLSENIEAISILDRFLEHSRVWVFENGGKPKFFIGSADWMPRNLDFRVEVTTPIYEAALQRQLRDHLDIIWKDNVKSRWHDADQENDYRQILGPKIRSQYALYEYAKNQLKQG